MNRPAGHTASNATDRRHRPDRRRHHEIGLLNPTASPERQRSRRRARVLVGLVQVLFGTFVVSGSLTLMFRQFSIEELLGCLLGAFLIYQGVWMVGQQERRRRNRREELRRTMIAPGTRETLG